MHRLYDKQESHFGRRRQHAGPGGQLEGPPGPSRGPRGGRRANRRGRAQRGDVRIAILLLLSEEPMHGYQIMQAISDRTSGRWSPSPGAVYPAISQLEDEGLAVAHSDSGRKVVGLTEGGQALVEANRQAWPDPFGGDDATGPDLRKLSMQLAAATRQVASAGTPAQIQRAADLLSEARRSMYLLLAEEPTEQ